ncbi:MAG: hypothetical protein ACP5Q3_07615, partial [bacterium]
PSVRDYPHPSPLPSGERATCGWAANSYNRADYIFTEEIYRALQNRVTFEPFTNYYPESLLWKASSAS